MKYIYIYTHTSLLLPFKTPPSYELASSSRQAAHLSFQILHRDLIMQKNKAVYTAYVAPRTDRHTDGRTHALDTVQTLYKGLEGTVKCCLLYQVDLISGVLKINFLYQNIRISNTSNYNINYTILYKTMIKICIWNMLYE